MDFVSDVFDYNSASYELIVEKADWYIQNASCEFEKNLFPPLLAKTPSYFGEL